MSEQITDTCTNITPVFAKIEAAQLAKYKLSQNLCGNCPAYNKRWACPPFDNDIFILFQKKYANIVAIKFEPIQKNFTQKEITDSARKYFDNIFYSIESSTKNSILLLAGSCICKYSQKCPKIKNKPCAFPTKMRYSLEALNFDVVKICKQILNFEILWAKDKKHPPYYTLVYCLLTNDDFIDENFLRSKLNL